MTFLSFLVKILKSLCSEIVLILLFFSLLFFWYFNGAGQGTLSLFLAFLIFIGSLYFYIKRPKKSLEFLVFLNVFLWYFALYNFGFSFSLPIYLQEILIFLLTFGFLFYLLFYQKIFEKRFLIALSSFSLSLAILETFLVLAFWPTNPLSKSLILFSIFYLFFYVIIKQEKALSYLSLVALVLMIVIATTKWGVF